MKTNSIALAVSEIKARQAICQIIQSFGRFNIVIEASNGMELIDKIVSNKTKPDIAFFDDEMPILDGLGTLSYLCKNYEDLKSVVICKHDDFKTVFNVIQMGACGYIFRDSSMNILERTLLEVATVGSSFSHFIDDRINEHRRYLKTSNRVEEDEPGFEILSPRELEFVKLCCTELTYKEIAEQMKVVPKTVDSFRDHVFQKLNVHTRTGIVLFANNPGGTRSRLDVNFINVDKNK
jgi:DNA-binding NarL/FixJ family response regulator